MPLFDAYVFVDWSAANGPGQGPGPNAVWVGELIRNVRQLETYHRTRNGCFNHVRDILLEQVDEGRRTLVGFDFAYGYPAGFSHALALPLGGGCWWAVWSELAYRVQDNQGNVSNRFTAASELNAIAGNGNHGPFWGCPPADANAHLHVRSPGFPFRATSGVQLNRLRIVEARLHGVQETWRLYGPGSVGSQTLVGIPYVYRLRRQLELAQSSRVWPFETGFTVEPTPDDGPFILHAEIWPGVVKEESRTLMNNDPGLIRDQAQVRAMCAWAARLDDQDLLGDMFDTPNNLNRQDLISCANEEGWILGAQ